MPSLADSLVSSSARPLAIRRRPDLDVTKQRYQGRQYWIVKDPVGLNYFRFQEEEFNLLNWLDGETSLDESAEPLRKTIRAAKNHAGRVGPLDRHAASKRAGDRRRAWAGKTIAEAALGTEKKEWMAALSNVLAIRFKGIDPERFFNWLYPYISWFFTKTAAAFCLTAVRLGA